jgi:hypothetical protein
MGGSALDEAKQVRHGQAGFVTNQEMDMVRHPADLEKAASLVPDDAAHVLIEALTVVRRDQRSSVLRAEDKMNQKARIRVPHCRAPLDVIQRSLFLEDRLILSKKRAHSAPYG